MVYYLPNFTLSFIHTPHVDRLGDNEVYFFFFVKCARSSSLLIQCTMENKPNLLSKFHSLRRLVLVS